MQLCLYVNVFKCIFSIKSSIVKEIFLIKFCLRVEKAYLKEKYWREVKKKTKPRNLHNTKQKFRVKSNCLIGP